MAELRQQRIQSLSFILSACAAFVFCCFYVSNLTGFNQTINQDRIELYNRINPNNATIASLTRLPGIGAAKAEAIVTFRKNFQRNNREGRPFQSPDDLQKVNGIGPKTAQNIGEWLKFE